MQSIDISSTTSDNSDHRHGALRRYTFVLVYGSFSRCFNWAWKNHSNEVGSSSLRGLGGSRKPARHRAFICLYCITAVDTMWPATALSRAFPVVMGSIPWPVNQTECPSPLKLLLFLNLITVTIKATNAGFNQSHSTHLKPYQSRNHFFCLCVISCVGKMSVSWSIIYNSLALFLYMPFFPLDWGFSFFLCFLSVCPCSQALIRVSSGFNCSLKPSTLTPNLHHSPSRDFRDTEEQEISIRQNIFWRLSDTVLTKSK